jgi:hypothetical protein
MFHVKHWPKNPMPGVSAKRIWRERPSVSLAALGLLSGLLSAAVGFTLRIEQLDPLAGLFFLSAEMLPIGFLFGAVVAGVIAVRQQRALAVPVLLVTTMYAWSAAIHTTIKLHQIGGGDAGHVGPLLGGLVGGAVGAGLTQLGAAQFAAELRQPRRLAVTCAVGAAAGLLFYLGDRNIIDARVLFVVWQPAVAFCIGLGLGAEAGHARSPSQGS